MDIQGSYTTWKVMEFDLGTWKFIDSIKHLESRGILFQYCDQYFSMV